MKNHFLKTKKEITSWLDKHNVEEYALVEDLIYGYVINVNGYVNLSKFNLTSIPIKFNHISGDFGCYNNQLTTLEFCPTTVGGRFYCQDNQLTSLEFCPTTVGGTFSCRGNQLTSLEFCPTTVGGNFYCGSNQLTSLQFCPTNIADNFSCYGNQLNSLEFCPTNVGGEFYCHDNPALKDIQEIRDFTQILAIHQETLIQIEKQHINKQLKQVEKTTVNTHNSDTDNVSNKVLFKL